MHVIATAGHVDHGKSTLVRALTGQEPDRWADERRRGLTIDLGFAWTTLSSGRTVAFVDVPGHERFVSNMLAGVGPVPAVLLVVAADEGWMPQSAEHLAALAALGVRHGLLVITRSDLADPGPALAAAREQLAGTGLAEIPEVVVSVAVGTGLDQLRSTLDQVLVGLPEPVTDGPVRLWVDRAFTIRGSGTVVTGTLRAGQLAVGDQLLLSSNDRMVTVRGLQTLGEAATRVSAVSRVAVNLRGVDRDQVRRGDALLTPERFTRTDVIDVRLTGESVESPPSEAMLHLGSAAVPVRVRPLGPDTVRLRLARPLPLHVGDRALLRDPGRHWIVGGAIVLDVTPPPLPARRGAAAERAKELADYDGRPDLRAELRRRRLVQRADLVRMGVAATTAPVAGDWLADPDWWQTTRQRMGELVHQHIDTDPLAGGVPLETLRQALRLPDLELVAALVTPPLAVVDGRVSRGGQRLPEPVRQAVARVRAELAAHPFRAPEAGQLAKLGLGAKELAAAVRAGALLRIADQVVLAPDAVERAAVVLADLPQPFTLSQARQALDTTRRVAVPLLELLDQRGVTRRLPDDRRTLA